MCHVTSVLRCGWALCARPSVMRPGPRVVNDRFRLSVLRCVVVGWVVPRGQFPTVLQSCCWVGGNSLTTCLGQG